MTQTFEQWAESEGLDMSVDWKGDLTSPVTAGALRGWEAAQSARQEAVAWRDAIETAVQVLSHIEAGDDVFVGQASEAIAGLTAILHAPTIPPTFEQARDALCDALDAYPPKRDAAPVNGGERALDLLETLFEAYENGPACYEDPSEQAGFVGNAVRLDDETFHACADLLNLHRPRDSERAADAQQVGEHDMRDEVTKALGLPIGGIRDGKPVSFAWSYLLGQIEQLVLLAERYAEESKCPGCEGKPAPQNNPCVVCGKRAAEAKQVGAARYEKVDGCKDCRHAHYYSADRWECLKANRMFDELGRPVAAPAWCPLPALTSPAKEQK